MTDKDVKTPRVFLFRHGETEWSKSGHFTSFSEIDLTPTGRAQVRSTAALLVGSNRLIDPHRIAHVFASPRERVRTTLNLLLPSDVSKEKITFTEDITEWNYGKYEGMKKEEIRSLTRKNGWDKEREWDVWSDGCEDGESVQQVTDRLDKLILQIKNIQKPHMHGINPADVVLVAHGLILRCFVKRWLGYKIGDNLPLMFETAAVGIVSYRNNNVEDPALHVAVSFPYEE